MTISGQHFIQGEWRASRSGKLFESLNPATAEPVGVCAAADQVEVAAAVQAAKDALPGWRRTPAPRRANVLFRLAALLGTRQEQLARLVATEMGKPLVEARADVQEAIDMALYMAGEGRRMSGHTVPSELPDKFAMSLREPVGVVAAITPWNFPIAVPSWKLLPALVLGNTVVWKPSPESPLCAVELTRAFVDAGLPAGVLNLVLGDGDVGAALVEQPAVRLVSFTGSDAVGRRVAARCGELGKRCALELGGKNAVIVLADADLDLAAEGIVWSAFGTSGQRCTACSRVIVQLAAREELVRRLVDRTRRLRLGDPLDPATEIGPVINAAALRRIDQAVQQAVGEGARLLTGGRTVERSGWFYEPTWLDGVAARMRIAQEEVFGPVCALIEVADLAEAIEVANDVRYGLVSSVFTRDVNRAFHALRELDSGMVYVNAGTTGSEVQLPFGGTRGTGNGAREAGQAALDTFSEWKTVYVDYSGKLQRAQMDRGTT